MSNKIKRVFVEKRPEFAIEAQELLADLKQNLGLNNIKSMRILNRYDVLGLTDEEFLEASQHVLSEPPVDMLFEEELILDKNAKSFVIELLPGQYDQREDFAEQCVQLITQKEKPMIANAKVYIFEGEISDADMERIKKYCINPIEAREASWEKPATLQTTCEEPARVAVLKDFNNLTRSEM